MTRSSKKVLEFLWLEASVFLSNFIGVILKQELKRVKNSPAGKNSSRNWNARVARVLKKVGELREKCGFIKQFYDLNSIQHFLVARFELVIVINSHHQPLNGYYLGALLFFFTSLNILITFFVTHKPRFSRLTLTYFTQCFNWIDFTFFTFWIM